MDSPLISIIIVSYNSRLDLSNCLPAIQEIEVSLEIIVVDNGSSDGTIEWLRSTYPSVIVIQSLDNTGYAGGNNLGVHHASGSWILLLNPDTEVHPGAIQAMLETAIRNPNCVVIPKLVLPDGRVNACGVTMHYTGLTSCSGLGARSSFYSNTFPTLLASGAVMLMSRILWDDVGGFDPSYFMYMEDVDLSLRLRLFGYSILCAADATVTHRYHLKMDPRKFYHLERNRIVTLLKCYEWNTMIRLLPGLMLTEMATCAFALLNGTSYIRAKLKGYRWVLENCRSLYSYRKSIQRRRKIKDQELLSLMQNALPIRQLVPGPLAEVLFAITTPVYRVIHRNSIRS